MTEGEAPTSRIASLCKEIGWLKIQILTSQKNGDETQQAELQARLNALLTEHTQLQREQVTDVQEADYDIGDEVECRDSDSEEWQLGIVTSVQPLLVRPLAFTEPFEWDHVRRPVPSEEHEKTVNRCADSDVEADKLALHTTSGETSPIPNLVQDRVESPFPFVESVANAVAAAEAACRRCGVRTPESFRRAELGIAEDASRTSSIECPVPSKLYDRDHARVPSSEISHERRQHRSPVSRIQAVNMHRNDIHMQQRTALAKPLHANSREHSPEHLGSAPRLQNKGRNQAKMSQLFDTLQRRAQASSKEQKALEQRARQLDVRLRTVKSSGRREERTGVARKKAEAELIALKRAFDARLQKLSDRDRCSFDGADLLSARSITPQRSRLAPSQRMRASSPMASVQIARKATWGSQLGPSTSVPGRVRVETRSESETQRIPATRKTSSSSQASARVQESRSVSSSTECVPDSSANAFVWRQHSIGSAEVDESEDENISDQHESSREAEFIDEQRAEPPAPSSGGSSSTDQPNMSPSVHTGDVDQEEVESSQQDSLGQERTLPEVHNRNKCSIALDMGPGTLSEVSFVVNSETELCTLPSTPAIPPRTIPMACSTGNSSHVNSHQLRDALEVVANDSNSRSDIVTPNPRGEDLRNDESFDNGGNTTGDTFTSGGGADESGGSPLFVMFPQRWATVETNGDPSDDITAPPMSWGTASVAESVSIEGDSDSQNESRTITAATSSEQFSAIVEAPSASIVALATTAAFTNPSEGPRSSPRHWSPPPPRRLTPPARSTHSSTGPSKQITPRGRGPSPPPRQSPSPPPCSSIPVSEEHSVINGAPNLANVMDPSRQYRRSLSSGKRSQPVFSRLACSHTASSQARQDELIGRSQRVSSSSGLSARRPSGTWQP